MSGAIVPAFTCMSKAKPPARLRISPWGSAIALPPTNQIAGSESAACKAYDPIKMSRTSRRLRCARSERNLIFQKPDSSLEFEADRARRPRRASHRRSKQPALPKIWSKQVFSSLNLRSNILWQKTSKVRVGIRTVADPRTFGRDPLYDLGPSCGILPKNKKGCFDCTPSQNS